MGIRAGFGKEERSLGYTKSTGYLGRVLMRNTAFSRIQLLLKRLRILVIKTQCRFTPCHSRDPVESLDTMIWRTLSDAADPEPILRPSAIQSVPLFQ